MSTIYDVLRRPIITEKSNYQNQVLQQFVFEVTSDATKKVVKEAVETIFDVTVLKVNIMKMPPKQSRNLRTRRRSLRRSGYKKAVVTLAAGDTIQVFEGVK